MVIGIGGGLDVDPKFVQVQTNLNRSIPQIAAQRQALAARPPPAAAPKPRESSFFKRNLGLGLGLIFGGPLGGMIGRGVDTLRAQSAGIERQNARGAQQREAQAHNQGVKEYAAMLQQVADARMEFTAKNAPRLFPQGWLRMQESGALAIVPGKDPETGQHIPGSVNIVQARLGDDGKLDVIFKSKADVDGFLDQVLGGDNIKLNDTAFTPRGRFIAQGTPNPIAQSPGGATLTFGRGVDGAIISNPIIKAPPVSHAPPGPKEITDKTIGFFWKGKWFPVEAGRMDEIRKQVLDAQAAGKSGGKSAARRYTDDFIARHKDMADALLGSASLSSEAITLGLALEKRLGRGKSMDVVSKFVRGARDSGSPSLEAWLDANGHPDMAKLLRRAQDGPGAASPAPATKEKTFSFFGRGIG